MLAHLADVSIRAVAVALIAAAALAIMRGRRRAATEHAVWTAVVCGMLGLFVFGSALPRLPVRVLRTQRVQVTQPVEVVLPVAVEGVEVHVPAPQIPAPRDIDWFELGYGAVALAFIVRFAMGMFLVRRLVAKSARVERFHESRRIAVPLTVGWFQPVILLPTEWREWDPAKLDMVLAHERAHSTRHDGLIAAMAALNRCVFWFHPLAWWLERRLAFLAEIACDEACVAATGDREQYAQLLVEMAQVVDRAQGRLRGHALAMAASSHIGKRVESILKEGRTFSRGLSWAGCAAIALCGAPLIWGAGAVTLERRMLAQVETKLRFEVASVRPAATMAPSEPVAGGRGGGGEGGSCIDRFAMDAGRVDIRCLSLQELISYAYRIPQLRVTGPDWISGRGTPKFDIAAKFPEGASQDKTPEMMQALLEDRFHLAMHRGSREETVYALVVAKGGSKLKQAAPGADASPAADPAAPPANVVHLGEQQGRLTMLPDGSQMMTSPLMGTVRLTLKDGISRLDAPSTTLGGLAALVGQTTAQEVTDRTELAGRYQVVLESSTAEVVAAGHAALADAQAGGTTSMADAVKSAQLSAVRSALLKLGLALEPRKGTVETIVVDHVDRAPTQN